MTAYPHLFSPLRIGRLTVRNRFLQTAHTKHFAHEGLDTERDLAYHVERARGGAALLITGNRLVHPTSSVAAPAFPRGYLRRTIPFDRRMTAAVHTHGAFIIAQLNHVGVNGSSDAADDLRYLLGPSAVRSPLFSESPKVMEPEDLREVAAWWGLSATLAREGGFDGVEVHLAHGYLLHQFLSPLYNQRTDEYGGSFDNRLRFPRAVIETVRQRVGDDFVVGVRLPLADGVEGGLTVEDAARLAAALEATTRIDYVNVTVGGYHDGLALAIAPADTPDGWLLELIARVKAAVTRLPVFAVGGIKDAAQAEQILTAGQADMVAITRAQIADPEFPNKVREGREDEIYHCIRGNQGCVSRTGRGLPMACTVNPAAGREQRFGGPLLPTPSPRSWVVVGGGPAGLKAAETLARRGHRVTLLEQTDRLGGQVNLIVKTPGREAFGWIVRDLETQLRKLEVDVRLNTTATAELVCALHPDGVIVATGSLPARTGFSSVAPLVTRLPGVDQDNVLTGWDVLQETRPVGERVLVLDDDGGRYAAGAAEVLLDRGKRVEVVTRFTALFPATAATLDQGILYRRLFGKGLAYRLNLWARAIQGRSVTLYNLYTGAETTLDNVDTIVLATGQMANDALYLALKGRVPELHRIGDCLAPRKLDHAIYEGYLAGRELLASPRRYILEGELGVAAGTAAPSP